MGRLLATLLAGLLLCAQTPMLPGFPPGTFQNRAAIDAGSAPAAPTFDPANKDSGLTLSAGNLTATMSGVTANRSVMSTTSHGSGKYYFEFTVNGGGFNTFGLANASFNVSAGTVAGFDASNSIGTDSSGTTRVNAGSVGTAWGWIAGDTLGVAIDFTAQKIWFKDITFAQPWNNSGSDDPATGTGGTTLAGLNAGPYFVVASLAANGGVDTVNFGATAYAGTAPSGFGNW